MKVIIEYQMIQLFIQYFNKGTLKMKQNKEIKTEKETDTKIDRFIYWQCEKIL